MKRALITGITGQDGSYLAELLLTLGYEVHGVLRRTSAETQEDRMPRLAAIRDRIIFHSATLESLPSLFKVLAGTKFDECYHLAAQSFVPESFVDSFSTFGINISGTHFLLESLRELQRDCRFLFAASSEMFGKVREAPQNENTPFHPRSPYGISKVTGFELTRNYRESYGMFCASAICFNHESPRRGSEFVTRKISRAAARISQGFEKKLQLGNLEARRDWGHAADYVQAMQLILNQPTPDDFVIATGETHSVREFCELAFSHVGLNYLDHVQVNPELYRPAEVETLTGDASKARRMLDWSPTRTFRELVTEMVDHDLETLRASLP
jgi:GDPmannose 4,6-dehydratase